ncbi:blue light receptor [Schizophyllum amplum]|uniref:Blue light receptor n=1 Tax=Schizophyllum amplum TaxID=97359 RepID=A0A550C3D3_9AGAR|nr:blue light receptor [Auriculariopsis ampla]
MSTVPGRFPPSLQKSTSGPGAAQLFEFTKRKRWADLLITELADAIILVLAVPNPKILYCGAAVEELLGWRDADVIDLDLTELMNQDDQHVFQTAFHDSINTEQELLAYVRLKCNSNKDAPHTITAAYHHQQMHGHVQQQPSEEVLFEIKGYPHYQPDRSQCWCFFAMARPYPSRNTAMLNTFFDLKIENERLQQRLVELRSQQPAPATVSSATATAANSFTSSSSYPATTSSYATGSSAYPHGPATQISYYSDVVSSPVTRTGYDAGAMYGGPSYSAPVHAAAPEDEEDGSSKKKRKKSHAGEQYVCITCGRTDSPEWRKGPLGPKTLCNACGLRWAKQQRRTDDQSGEGTGNSH